MMGMKDAYACMTPGCYMMSKADIKARSFPAGSLRCGPRTTKRRVLAFARPDPISGKLRYYYADRRQPFGWRGSPRRSACRLSSVDSHSRCYA